MIKHSYILAGMTCSNCMATVKRRLSSHPAVVSVDLELNPQSAVIKMEQEIATADLQKSLGDGKYQIYDDLAAGNHASS